VNFTARLSIFAA